jgi:hypothetical protein
MPSKDTMPTLAPHHEQIVHALRERADSRNPKLKLSREARPVVQRIVTKLANLAKTRRRTSHAETYRRAVAEIMRRGRESFRASEYRTVESSAVTLARWLEIADWMPPAEPKKELPPLVRQKGVRRIRVNGNWLEGYGVEMNDRLLVAMTGEVRPGELGYFELHRWYDTGADYRHASFFFVSEINKTCRQENYIKQEGICLRIHASKCTGEHVGSEAQPVLDDSFNRNLWKAATPYGRVCGVERDRQPVETTLNLRPYDEREGQTAGLSQKPEPKRKRKVSRQRVERADGKSITIVTPSFDLDGADLFCLTMPDDVLAPVFPQGSRVLVRRTSEVARGSLAVVETEDGPCIGFIYDDGPEGITLTSCEEGDRIHFDAGRAKIGGEVIGPALTPEEAAELKKEKADAPPAAKPNPNQKRIDELRRRVEGLNRGDSDDILNCTERYRLEKQIYDLEHPEPEPADDWPDDAITITTHD